MFGLRLSSAATSRFRRPATTSSTICRSVSDSSLVRGGASADPPQLRTRLLQPQPRAEPLEDLRLPVGATRGRRACAAPGAARFRARGACARARTGSLPAAARAQRAAASSGAIARSTSPCEARSRPRQRRTSGRRAASPSAARRSSCASNRSAWRSSPLRKQRLDPSRAGQPGEVHVELLDVVERLRDLPQLAAPSS